MRDDRQLPSVPEGTPDAQPAYASPGSRNRSSARATSAFRRGSRPVTTFQTIASPLPSLLARITETALRQAPCRAQRGITLRQN